MNLTAKLALAVAVSPLLTACESMPKIGGDNSPRPLNETGSTASQKEAPKEIKAGSLTWNQPCNVITTVNQADLTSRDTAKRNAAVAAAATNQQIQLENATGITGACVRFNVFAGEVAAASTPQAQAAAAAANTRTRRGATPQAQPAPVAGQPTYKITSTVGTPFAVKLEMDQCSAKSNMLGGFLDKAAEVGSGALGFIGNALGQKGAQLGGQAGGAVAAPLAGVGAQAGRDLAKAGTTTLTPAAQAAEAQAKAAAEAAKPNCADQFGKTVNGPLAEGFKEAIAGWKAAPANAGKSPVVVLYTSLPTEQAAIVKNTFAQTAPVIAP